MSEGYAINTLKEAAQQAEVEFIFSADLVEGVRTSPIQGEFTPIEAFSLMLAETSLEVFQHKRSRGGWTPWPAAAPQPPRGP